MKITPAMIDVARRAEQETTGSLIATPHAVVEAMLHAALAVAPDPQPDAGPEIEQRSCGRRKSRVIR